MTHRKPTVVYFFTFLLAFCSLFYELVYAQVLSVCLGGTKNQYLTIISLFTCALGFGSIVQGKLKNKYPLRKTFFWIEISLTLLGSLGPFLITWLLRPGTSEIMSSVSVAMSYLIVFLIGFLSGFEIPSLFAMLENAQGKILAFDYLGMLVASILFPFLFLPQLGTAPSVLLVAGANVLGVIWLRSDNPNPRVNMALYALTFSYFVGIVLMKTELNLILSRLYLGGI
jgi:spermidine synthase